jgi:hypothetical protein
MRCADTPRAAYPLTVLSYSAVTCDPDDFAKCNFTLRPVMYGRDTELLIGITMFNVRAMGTSVSQQKLIMSLGRRGPLLPNATPRHECARPRWLSSSCSDAWRREHLASVLASQVADLGYRRMEEGTRGATHCTREVLRRADRRVHHLRRAQEHQPEGAGHVRSPLGRNQQ